MRFKATENIDILDQAIDFPIKDISPRLVKYCYHKIIELHFVNSKPTSKSKRLYVYKQQYRFVQQDLLKLKYKRNGYSAKGIKEGYVYAIGNPQYTNYVKFGSAIDVRDRLNQYQTYSPFRDYYLIQYAFCTDRVKEEKLLLSKYCKDFEWCELSEQEARKEIKIISELSSASVAK